MRTGSDKVEMGGFTGEKSMHAVGCAGSLIGVAEQGFHGVLFTAVMLVGCQHAAQQLMGLPVLLRQLL